MKKTLLLFICFVMLLSFCACGISEKTSEAEQIQLNAETNPASQTNENRTDSGFAWNEVFISDDGLIEITVHDDSADAIPTTMPVLRVRPQVITSDMAKQMAAGLFGNAVFFEYSEEMCKSEIADMIAVCEYAVTDEAIFKDYGINIPNSQIDSIRNARLAILEYYRNAYANARDEVMAVPCQWKFWPIEHYAFHDYEGSDPSYTNSIPTGISVDLRAVTTVDGTPYELWINNNEDADFRNHSLSVFVLTPDGLLSGGISYEEREDRLKEWNLQMGLCSSLPASETELTAACDCAADMALQMGLGEWHFFAKAVEIIEGNWQIELTGQPMYEGYPVNWQNPNEHQDFYLESLIITTTNDGTLVDLRYTSPLEIVETVEQTVPLKTWNEVSPIAAQAMRSWSYNALIPNYESEKSWWDSVGAKIIETKVGIDDVCVGYTRIPYDSADFLLIPTVTFPGKLEVIGNIPNVHESPMNLLTEDECRYNISLVLDLRDGTAVK